MTESIYMNMDQKNNKAKVISINISKGGVPKHPVKSVNITEKGF